MSSRPLGWRSARVGHRVSGIVVANGSDLVKIGPKRPDTYEGLPLTSLTAYSLYWLHAWELRPSIESIAVLNWRLFPNMFAMVGFHQFPDALRTNRSLLQGQPKYRNLLTGTPSEGYSLNQQGVHLAETLTLKLGPPVTGDGQPMAGTLETHLRLRPVSRPRTLDPQRDVDRARDSRLFSKWRSGQLNSRDVIHVHSLLGIFDHTPAKERVKALKELTESAEAVGDDQLIELIRNVREMFPTVFARRSK